MMRPKEYRQFFVERYKITNMIDRVSFVFELGVLFAALSNLADEGLHANVLGEICWRKPFSTV